MSRTVTLVGIAATLVFVAACSKTEPAKAPADGPALNPPVQEEPATPPTTSDAPQGAAIGAQAPAWANLEGTDGKQHSLKDLAGADVVAVVFTCNHCPVAQAYEDRLVKFANDYKDKRVELVAINVSNLDQDKLPAMKERAEEKGFDFAYLYDPSQQIGREFGATTTPHAFVLDKSRNIAYMGAIDDNQDESAVEKHYLRDAVDALLAGKAPEVATSQQFGCSIRYE